MPNTFSSGYDECQENLARLIQYDLSHSKTRNEAATRLHLIDTLLFECLGWEKHDVLPEEHQRTNRNEYTDYTFYAPRRIMILEAKREGEYFGVPASKSALTYTLKSICRGNANLKSAVNQVAGYCQSRGVPLAIVSNGHQLLAFVAVRNDGVPPMDGKTLVFPSLQFMYDHFLDFWNAASKSGIENKMLQARLLGSHQPELPPPLSATISDYPGTKGRNVIQAELKNITELVIEDIPESSQLEPDFLTNCYCHSGALSQHSLASKAILRARYSILFDQSSAARPTMVSATDTAGVSQELYAESMSRRPILLIGNVGVGKSIFIRHLIGVDAADLFSNAITIRIDLGTSAVLTSELKDFVINEIAVQLMQRYSIDIEERNFVRGVYDLDLKKFRRSIYGELQDTDPQKYKEKELEFLERKVKVRAEHCRCALEHMSKSQSKQVVAFLDNADQRGDATQDEAFLIAQELAARWPVLVYVPLRPETFHRSVDRGALSGYHPKAFTVSPPRIDDVLDKRLRYALSIATGIVPCAEITSGGREVSNLTVVLKSFLKSLRENYDLVECIDNIAGGNVRRALDLVKNFFGSGHVDTLKIIEKSSQRLYIVPLHEFLRSMIFGDFVHYHPDRSIVANLFDISTKDSREHFALPILLAILRQAGQTNRGYMNTEELYMAIQGLGFTADQLDFAIVRAYRKGLVEMPIGRALGEGVGSPRMLRATTVGLYHVDRLSSRVEYVDAMTVTTPILDSDVRSQVRDVQTIEERLERTTVFQNYLDKKWIDASFPPLAFHWPSVSSELSKRISEVRERNLARRRRDASQR